MLGINPLGRIIIQVFIGKRTYQLVANTDDGVLRSPEGVRRQRLFEILT